MYERLVAAFVRPQLYSGIDRYHPISSQHPCLKRYTEDVARPWDGTRLL
jgi:hypothetical protein